MGYLTPAQDRLQGFPEGWFALAFSREVKPGQVLRRKLMDKDVAVYRTDSGKVKVIDAFCPHMGAHLGVGGKVKGESISCPFHGFSFDGEGQCESTPYKENTPPKTKACLNMLETAERFGTVLCFYTQDGSKADWQVSSPDENKSQLDWSDTANRIWKIRTHPAEIIENTVDIGHFSPIHKYEDVSVVKELNYTGCHLNMGYTITRNKGLFGRLDKSRLVADLDINASGVGHSRVEVDEKKLGLQIRYVVMPTPVNNEQVEVRVITQIALPENTAVNLLTKVIPKKVLQKIIAEIAATEMGNDFIPDINIWENKIYVEKPKLAKGDGPIMKYRKWAAKFQNLNESKSES